MLYELHQIQLDRLLKTFVQKSGRSLSIGHARSSMGLWNTQIIA